MHPILGDQLRLRLHLTAWSLGGGGLALLVRSLFDVEWMAGLVFGIPMGLVAAPVSLSAWYLCKAMPLARTSTWRIGATAAGAAVVTGSLWAALGRWWWQLLATTGFEMPLDQMVGLFSLMLGLGSIGYLLAVTVHYVLQAGEDSALAERRALESQVAQREAELRSLRAQVDPHFLFNSLNSIVGLMAIDQDQARVMCLRLAEFLRDSLTLGGEQRITLGREIGLAEQYLSVERVRFGPRLQVTTVVALDAAPITVPPLILQPLVENAVRHGVATLLEGGEVRIEVSVVGPRALIAVSNPYDPDVRRRGTGFGMDIVRRRLAATFGDQAALTVEAQHGQYRAALTVPVDRAGSLTMTQPLRVIVVDDELPARMALIHALKTFPDVEIAGECQNGFDAVKAVHDLKPDAVLLDVHMPKLDGFDVLELIGVEVPVVFVTAHDEFAIRAFEVHAVDYLLKPVSPERLRTALDRVRERGRAAPSLPAQLHASARRPGELLERVVIRDGPQVHVIPLDKVDYIEAQDDYVGFRTGGKTLLKEQTMADVEASLDPRRFVRIHRSYVLNVERLSRVELYAKDSRVAILTDGTKLPVSRSGYQRLQALL